jgi:hypothetical protein
MSVTKENKAMGSTVPKTARKLSKVTDATKPRRLKQTNKEINKETKKQAKKQNTVVAHPTLSELRSTKKLFFKTFNGASHTTDDCLAVLSHMTPTQLPHLDVVVIAALERFIRDGVISMRLPKFKRPLFVGSGNAAVTGQIIADQLSLDAIFADEGNYAAKISAFSAIDGAILVSASGSKHAISIAKDLQSRKRKIPVVLLTNNPNAPAAEFIGYDKTHIFVRNPEPYTYNTSTYMSMVLAASGEDPKQILSFMTKVVDPVLSKLPRKKAYMLLVMPEHDLVRPLLYTKFDELFGGVVCGRVFTTEQVKHAKTVVPSSDELVISFGFSNKTYGYASNRLMIPLPSGAGIGTIMAISYYVIGKIQASHPDYFGKNIVSYCKDASKLFGVTLEPIVK